MATINILQLTIKLITITLLIVGFFAVDVGAQEAQGITKADITDLRADLKGDINNLKEVITTRIDGLDKRIDDVNGRIDTLQYGGVAVAGLVLSFLFYINWRMGKLEGVQEFKKEVKQELIQEFKQEAQQRQGQRKEQVQYGGIKEAINAIDITGIAKEAKEAEAQTQKAQHKEGVRLNISNKDIK